MSPQGGCPPPILGGLRMGRVLSRVAKRWGMGTKQGGTMCRWLSLQVAAWHSGGGCPALRGPQLWGGGVILGPPMPPLLPGPMGEAQASRGFPGDARRGTRWQRRGRVPAAFPVRGRAGTGGGTHTAVSPPSAHTCLWLLCHFQQGPGASHRRQHHPAPLGRMGTVPGGGMQKAPEGGAQWGGSVRPVAPAAHPQCCSHVSILLEELPAGSGEAA